MSVTATFERLAKEIAGWPADERAERLEKAARAFAQIIDHQAVDTRPPEDNRSQA